MSPKRMFASIMSLGLLVMSIPAEAATFTVSMRGGGSPNFFYFGNDELIIVVGDSVRWQNSSDAEHTVTAYRRGDGTRAFDSSKGTPDTGPCSAGPIEPVNDCIQPGQEFSFTFERAGTYNYFCKIHAQTAAETVKPDPRRSAQGQPCQMCAVIEVRTPATQRPGTSGGGSGSSGGSNGGTATTKPKVTSTPRASDTAVPTTGGSEVAAGEPSGGGGGAKTAIALLAIVALSGAGYAIWRKFLVVR